MHNTLTISRSDAASAVDCLAIASADVQQTIAEHRKWFKGASADSRIERLQAALAEIERLRVVLGA